MKRTIAVLTAVTGLVISGVGIAQAEGVSGSSRADVIVTGDGNDAVAAQGGDDWIETNGGRDGVAAGDGNDYIDLGSGRDGVSAGSGNDEIHAADGYADTINCQGGRDTVYVDWLDRTLQCEYVIEVSTLP